MAFLLFLSIILGVAVVWYLIRSLRQSRRIRLLSTPPTKARETILEQRVPLYRAMPADLRRQLHGLMNVFLDEKQFIGCDGLEVSDDMRVVIAAQACVLLLNRDAVRFSGFQTIYLYPGTYIARESRSDGLLETMASEARAGEAWHRGPVVLSWEDVCAGAENPHDGFNVVLHEFAHKLDEENDTYDGLPVLSDPEHYRSWAAVLGREFDALRERVERGTPGVIDGYGAESSAEFFAVVTEAFFERPVKLQQQHPALYREFRKFYRVDPAEWHGLQ